MGISDVILDVVMGCNALYAAVVVCRMRRTWRELVFIGIIDALLITCADYVVRGIGTKYGISLTLFLIAAVCEMLQIVYTTYKCQGEFWRNMFFVMITIQLSSVVLFVLMSINSKSQKLLYLFINSELNVIDVKGTLIILISYAFAMVVSAIPMSMIYGRTRESVVYKYIVMVYYGYSVVSGIYRYDNVCEPYDNRSQVWMLIASISGGLSILVGMYLLGYAHKKSENQRIKKEVELLSLAVAEHCSRYDSLRKSNETLKQIRDEYENELSNYKDNAYAESLLLHSREIDLSVHTGGLVMDSALGVISERLEKEDVKFEYTFEDSFGAGSDTIMSEMDMAYILDKLSILTVMLNRNVSQDKFMVISERKISGAEVVKVEFSKDTKTKLKQDGNRLLANRLCKKDKKEMSDMMNEIHILVGKYDGVIHIEDEEDTASVSIMAR